MFHDNQGQPIVETLRLTGMNLRHRDLYLTLRLSVCAAAMLALAACSGQGSDPVAAGGASQSPTSSPTPSPTSSPTPSPTSSATSSPTSQAPETAPASEEPTTSTSPEPSTAAPAKQPRLIAYAGGESPGVEVHGRADAKDLRGAPAGFKRFIGRTAQRLTDRSTCSGGSVGVMVQTLRTDGYAVGGVNECGGYRALWAVVDGSWKEIEGTQEMWDCAVLKRYTVPSELIEGRCYDYQAQQERDYQQA